MKKLLKKFAKEAKGFTLIELIIVIAIIGVLAVALLAALNPTEQVNRSKDAALQIAAKALFDAENRYYAQQGWFPWCTSAADTTCTSGFTAGVAANSAAWTGGGESRLEATNELKSNFISGNTQTNWASIILSGAQGAGNPGGATPVVCYAPTSAAQLANATSNSTGGSWVSGTKYICIK